MTKLTLKSFTNKSHINPCLIRAVVRQFGDWSYFKETASDISNYGAAGGFSGFVYYCDTNAFTRRNKARILALAIEQDNQIEEVGLLAFLSSFNGLKDISQDSIAKAIYTGKGEDVIQVFNVLAWFALEEVARSLSDTLDEETYSN